MSSLDNRDLQKWRVLGLGFFICAVLLAVPTAFSQDIDAKAALRKDPDYGRLYHDGKAFLALPAPKQAAMRKLHEDLEKLAPAEREWLKSMMNRYADWLDKLPENSRQAIASAPDNDTRLRMIQELREKEWLARQPLATKDYLKRLSAYKHALPPDSVAGVVAMLAPSPRNLAPLAATARALATATDLKSDTIKRLKQDEARKSRDWLIAKRHWSELTAIKPTVMPSRASDFEVDVQIFIKEYLRPALSKQDEARLLRAEGQWPLYPLTLVELADKHPVALPNRSGPATFSALPTEIQKQITKSFPGKDGAKKNAWDQTFKKQGKKEAEIRLARVGVANATPAMKFAAFMANAVHAPKKGGKAATFKFPYEYWATRPDDMAIPMQKFLDPEKPFWEHLTADERNALDAALGQWPEYPLKVQELAAKYGFRPPWQTLPEVAGDPDIWDRYRVKSAGKTEAPP